MFFSEKLQETLLRRNQHYILKLSCVKHVFGFLESLFFRKIIFLIYFLWITSFEKL